MRGRSASKTRAALAAIGLAVSLVAAGGCGGDKGDLTVTKSTDPRGGGESGFDTPASTAAPGDATGDGTDDTAPTTPATSPEVDVPADPGEAVLASSVPTRRRSARARSAPSSS